MTVIVKTPFANLFANLCTHNFFMSWETQPRAAVAPTGDGCDAHCLQRHIVSMHATRATGHRAAMCKTAPCTPYSPVRLGAWILWGFCEASPSCASCMVVEACSTTCSQPLELRVTGQPIASLRTTASVRLSGSGRVFCGASVKLPQLVHGSGATSTCHAW